jgi:hypothetical protein
MGVVFKRYIWVFNVCRDLYGWFLIATRFLMIKHEVIGLVVEQKFN